MTNPIVPQDPPAGPSPSDGSRAAHQLANCLTTLLGHAEVALGIVPSDSPAAAALQRALQSAVEAVRLSRQLRTYLECRTSAAPSDTLLVVDDDEAVRGMLVTGLEFHGYNALAASDGVEALEVAAARGSTIKLAIVDLTLRPVGGLKVVEGLRHRQPRLPVVITSGGSEQVARSQIAGISGVRFLAKPFTPRDLAAQVGSLLAVRE